MRIDSVELDWLNIDHVTKRGISVTGLLAAFAGRLEVRRNKKAATGDYYVLSNGIRVNFIYDRETCTARPISAWRIQ